MASARTDEKSRVRTILVGASKGHIHIELEITSLEGHKGVDGRLLAGGVEAEFVEYGLDD